MNGFIASDAGRAISNSTFPGSTSNEQLDVGKKPVSFNLIFLGGPIEW